jgi:hypothetical protein
MVAKVTFVAILMAFIPSLARADGCGDAMNSNDFANAVPMCSAALQQETAAMRGASPVDMVFDGMQGAIDSQDVAVAELHLPAVYSHEMASQAHQVAVGQIELLEAYSRTSNNISPEVYSQVLDVARLIHETDALF